MGVQTIHMRYINLFGRRFVWYKRTINARSTHAGAGEWL